MTSRRRQLIRLLLPAALLAVVLWAVRGPPGGDALPPEIVITEADVAHVGARWMRQWSRPPTGDELRRAVDGYVRDEVLYREALVRGMDREDPRVRIALIQKMQMLSAGRADARGISEEDLASFFALRKEQYRIPARLSLAQVYFRIGEDEAQAAARAEDVLEQFSVREPGPEELAEWGDAILLQPVYSDLTAADVERLFGVDFAASALGLPEDEWSGPVRSGYGLHLVKVLDRTPGRTPELEEVRRRVEDDLGYENRKAAEEQGYQEIAGRYRVLVTDQARRVLEGAGGEP